MALAALVVLTVAGTALAVLGGESEARRSTGVIFEVGSAGTVLVRSTGDELIIDGVAATPGWDYRVERSTGPGVEVAFSSADTGIDFVATAQGSDVVGQIRIVSGSG